MEVMFEWSLEGSVSHVGFQGKSVVGKRQASVKLLGQKMLGTLKHQGGEWWLKQVDSPRDESEALNPAAAGRGDTSSCALIEMGSP